MKGFKYTAYFGLKKADGTPLEKGTVTSWLVDKVTGLDVAGTFTTHLGIYKGKTEESISFSSIGEEALKHTFHVLATRYAQTFEQECVLVEKIEVGFEFVEGLKGE
jgi:hypothetical protein